MTNFKKYIRIFFLFLISFFPWVDYMLRKLKIPLANSWDDGLIIFVVCFGLFFGTKRFKEIIYKPQIIFGALFASIALFSFVINDYLFLAFQHQFRLFFEPFLVFIAIFLIYPDKEESRIYLKMLVLSAALLSLVGIYQYIAKIPTPSMWVDKELESSSIYTRAFSIVGSPNVLAAYLELSLPLTIFLFLREKSFLKKFSQVFLFLVILSGLMLTFSRGGWLGAFGSIFVSFIFLNPLLGITVILICILGIFAVPVLRLRVFSLIDPSYIEKSMNSGGRLFRWRYGVVNGMEHPLLGTGLGTYGSSAAQKYGYFSYTSMDSVYINVFAETGLLGLSTFALWVASGVGSLIYKFFTKKKAVYLFIGASIIAILIHIFVENLFNVWGLTINFWALNALGEIIDD